MNTCGQCKWAKPIPGNLKNRVCMEGRPQIVVVPQQMPDGTMMFVPQTMFPNVAVNQEAPGCFKLGTYGVAPQDFPQTDVADFLRKRLAQAPEDN